MRRLIVAMAATAVIAGCGGGLEPGAGGATGVVEVVEDVSYYYACGNEVLQLPDGREYYPFVDQREVDADAYLGAPPVKAGELVAAAVLAVPAPEPGDDTGTLTIYEDGTARFESDSGIEAWLTEERQTYDWVC